MRQFIVEDLGKIKYAEAYTRQKTAQAALIQAQEKEIFVPHHLFFCEHFPVYTLGKSGKTSNQLFSVEQLAAAGIDYFVSDRGGDITYHGLGQLVIYFIADLHYFQRDLHWFLRQMEEVLLRTLDTLGLPSHRVEGRTGIWVGEKHNERKIAALGIYCKKWVTLHGAALNVTVDLSAFTHIIPCNIRDKGVTSLLAENKNYPLALLKEIIKNQFIYLFNLEEIHEKKT